MPLDSSVLGQALQKLLILASHYADHHETRYQTVVHAVHALNTVLERRIGAEGDVQNRNSGVAVTASQDMACLDQTLLAQDLLREAAEEFGTSTLISQPHSLPHSDASTINPQLLLPCFRPSDEPSTPVTVTVPQEQEQEQEQSMGDVSISGQAAQRMADGNGLLPPLAPPIWASPTPTAAVRNNARAKVRSREQDWPRSDAKALYGEANLVTGKRRRLTPAETSASVQKGGKIATLIVVRGSLWPKARKCATSLIEWKPS